MRRLLALLSLLAVLVVAGCAQTGEPPPMAAPAKPQRAALDWTEPFPKNGPGLVFTTRSLEVTKDGWAAEVAIENTTDLTWDLALDPIAVAQGFGLMLFETGNLDEVERRSRDGQLPGLRPARTFTPALPPALGPEQSWSGRISAQGALAAGRHARVVFGTLTTSGIPPDGLPTKVVWITDHAYQLR